MDTLDLARAVDQVFAKKVPANFDPINGDAVRYLTYNTELMRNADAAFRALVDDHKDWITEHALRAFSEGVYGTIEEAHTDYTGRVMVLAALYLYREHPSRTYAWLLWCGNIALMHQVLVTAGVRGYYVPA